MRLKFAWTPESRRWLETMPQRMDAALHRGIERGAEIAVTRGAAAAESWMPKFEGWAANDLCQGRGWWGNDGTLFETFIVFIGDRTSLSDTDTIRHPAPFHYPSAKHTPGADPHKVWLFSGSGEVTAHRRKLIRWLKLYGPDKWDWSLLPDAPTKELWNKKREPGFPPPFTYVDPGRSAEPYFDKLIANDGDPLAGWLIDGFWPFVKRAWEAA